MSDEDSIRDVINTYYVGTAERDLAVLQDIFHENAVMSGWLGPDLLVGSLQPFFDYVKNNEVGENYSSEVTDLWFEDQIATVEVKQYNLFGMTFTDRLQLVKQADKRWIIVAKLFRHY